MLLRQSLEPGEKRLSVICHQPSIVTTTVGSRHMRTIGIHASSIYLHLSRECCGLSGHAATVKLRCVVNGLMRLKLLVVVTSRP